MLIVPMVLGALVFTAAPAAANHVPPSAGVPAGASFNGTATRTDGAIDFVTNVPFPRAVAAPLGDGSPPFTRNGRRYMITSSTVYGLHVVDVTDPLEPIPVSSYSAASGCPTQSAEFAAARAGDLADPQKWGLFAVHGALGSISGWENDLATTPDGRIAVIGNDAAGRCHDPAYGGIELVDLTDVKNPRTLHLVRNVGESHSVTVDPKRPWLAYLSTSDGNDFVEIVDFRSCLGGVAKIEQCKPVVARAVLDPEHVPGIPEGKGDRPDPVSDGCHDIRFRGDRAYCAAIVSTVIFDVSGVVGRDGDLTGTHLTSGAGACPVVDATRAPGVKVTDCSAWTEDAFEQRKADSLRLRAASVIVHDGSEPPGENVQISHQAEAIDGGRIMVITDERGGGLGFGPGANAGPIKRADGGCPGGGIWFYDIRDDERPKLLRQPNGDPGVFISDNFVQTNASCTVHYGSELKGERLLAFAWYTAGTHVLRYDPDFRRSRITFDEIATYIPAGAWTIQALPLMRNPADRDQVIVYTGDAIRGMDVFLVDAPRARAAGGGGGGGAKVEGKHLARELPATGLGDPVALGLTLLVTAVFVTRRLRPAR